MSRRRGLAVSGLCVALFIGCQPATTHASFDYWVLALSWSPEYCASSAARPNSKQCAQAREFIVHGLWPQYERGYPQFCDTQARVSDHTADRLAPLMPDRGLVFHQWKKHGSCSGLGPDAYFATLQRAAGKARVPVGALRAATRAPASPGEVKDEFVRANPGLRADGIRLQCRSGYLREVRLCLDPDLRARACGKDLRDDCGPTLRVRAAP